MYPITVNSLKLIITIILTTLLMSMVACSSIEQYSYHPDQEVPEGPGLFTGEKGEYTLYRK